MDEIRIYDLKIYAYHGVFEEEKREGQEFFLNAVLYLDFRKAGQKDDLSLSVHYGDVCHFMNRYFTENRFQLIEAAAEHLAEAVLLKFPLIHHIELEIKKPHAPIGLPFGNISVKLERGWKKAYLGIGSNMGDREKYIADAIQKLEQDEKIRNLKCSLLIVTKPYGNVEQEDFLNGAIGIETLYTPYELLSVLQRLELEAGRERLVHWGPRTLDLDILLYEDFVSDDKILTVPHPDMQNRQFVLEPLNELCPYYVNQALQKSVRTMLLELREKE